MQKQPICKYPIEYSPFRLQEDFPISLLDDNPYILDEHEITSLHVHDCFEIGYCYEGNGIFIIDDKILPFKAGDVSIIFSNQFHKAQSEKGGSSKWDFVFVNVLQLLSDINVQDAAYLTEVLKGSSGFLNILKPEQHSGIIEVIKDIIEELRVRSTGYRSVIKGLIWTLVGKLGRLSGESSEEGGSYKNKAIVRILPALEYMSKHYMETIQISHTAELCSMSLTSFRRYFGNCLKMSPIEYLTKMRIQTASMLLTSTDYSIVEIASRVGYNSLSSFNRHFKVIQGVCPRHWRCGKIYK
jgi:AraC-like DNA-binding protein